MDFALNDEHRMVQQMVRDFAQKEVAPTIKEYDRKQEMAPFCAAHGGVGYPGYLHPGPIRRPGYGLYLIGSGL